MEHTVSLRPLHVGDAEAVAALVRRAFAAQSVPTDPPASALRLQAEDLRAHLAAGGGGAVAVGTAGRAGDSGPERSAIVAAEADPAPEAMAAEVAAAQGGAGQGGAAELVAAEADPVAAVMWSERDGGLYIARLAVDPAWRRRGLARLLMAAADAAAADRQLPRLHLGTRLVLADNRALFKACGFVEIAQHAHPGYAAPTWVELEKRRDVQER